MAKIENNNFKKSNRTSKDPEQNITKENSFANNIFNKEFFKKESKIYLISAILIPIVVFAGLFYYISNLARVEYIPKEEISEEQRMQKIIEKQTRALEDLNKDTQPLTEKEIQRQTEELDNLR